MYLRIPICVKLWQKGGEQVKSETTSRHVVGVVLRKGKFVFYHARFIFLQQKGDLQYVSGVMMSTGSLRTLGLGITHKAQSMLQ